MLQTLNTLRRTFAGLDAYIVGGYVRAIKSNEEPKDIDIVVRCHPRELIDRGAQPIFSVSAFPVFRLKIDTIGTVEIALPRTETKVAPGYFGFSTNAGAHIPIEEDLMRRDFTINAMAIRISDGTFIDPFNGLSHLKEKTLIHTSKAFRDDPLRIFRMYRFAAKGFCVHKATTNFVQSHNWSEDLDSLPVERVYGELFKAMAEKHPERFFGELVSTRVGNQFFPEVFHMEKVPAGPLQYHPEGNMLAHCLQTLRKTADITGDPVTRLCGFYHDLGKLATPPEQWPAHHNHDKEGTQIAKDVLRRLKAPNTVVKAVASVNALHMKARLWPSMRPSSRIKLCTAAKFRQVAHILPIVVTADSGIPMTSWHKVLDVCNLNVGALGIPMEWFDAHRKNPLAIQSMVMQKRVEAIADFNFS